MSKGKNPAKPLSKATMSLNEQLRRRREFRDLPERFLIVCEDDKSAVNYFEALKKQFNLSATSVRVVGSGGRTQPLQVVNRAVDLKENSEDSESGTEPFKYVWCVIDGDYGSKINNARKKAKANGVELAISTKCFEYWVLLHFEECDTSTANCDEVVSSLKKKHLPKYEKGSCDFSEIVKSAREACKRAKKLRKPGQDRGDLPEAQNPCSEVYLLIEKILPDQAG